MRSDIWPQILQKEDLRTHSFLSCKTQDPPSTSNYEPQRMPNFKAKPRSYKPHPKQNNLFRTCASTVGSLGGDFRNENAESRESRLRLPEQLQEPIGI